MMSLINYYYQHYYLNLVIRKLLSLAYMQFQLHVIIYNIYRKTKGQYY